MNIGIGVGVHLSGSKVKRKISDSFNRADSATTMSNADTGQPWVAPSTAWGITGNQGYSITSVANNMAYIESGTPNVEVSAKVKFSNNDGVMFRYSDTNNYLLVRIGTTSLAAFKVVAGSTSGIGTAYNFSPVVNTVYTVKVVCSGSSINVYLDGTLRITLTETFNQTATKHGLRVSASSGRFDDFLIDEL